MERLRNLALEVELQAIELERRAKMEYKVLDHGYVKLVEYWGTEERIIEAARMSTDKGFQGWESDEKLLAYLYKNKHMTPFEMVGMTIEVAAPIFVFREWHRHRVPFGYNEMSARYVPLPNINYLPSTADIVARSAIAANSKNRQAQGSREITPEEADGWLGELDQLYAHAGRVYREGLELGVPKELARLPVPVARYSRMRATSNLRGWLAFMQLRCAPTAQWEIRQYADCVGALIAAQFPRTYCLFHAGTAL